MTQSPDGEGTVGGWFSQGTFIPPERIAKPVIKSERLCVAAGFGEALIRARLDGLK
jgi:hypothetical protein